MTIHRANHKGKYTIILNKLIRDDRLSYGARGLLVYMLSHPADWDFSSIEYFYTCIDKRNKINNYMKELIQYGYLKRVIINNKKGIVRKYKYDIFEAPSVENQQMPCAENQQIPCVENQQMSWVENQQMSYVENQQMENVPVSGMDKGLEASGHSSSPCVENQHYNKELSQ